MQWMDFTGKYCTCLSNTFCNIILFTFHRLIHEMGVKLESPCLSIIPSVWILSQTYWLPMNRLISNLVFGLKYLPLYKILTGGESCMSKNHQIHKLVSMGHSFPFLFCLPHIWLYTTNSAGVARKAEDAYPTSAPDPCSWFVVQSEMLL